MLRRLNNRKGSVFDNRGNLIERGRFRYRDSRLQIQVTAIPISAIRSLDTNFNNRRALVFVDPAYNLNINC